MQLRVSAAVAFFEQALIDKYGFVPYVDPDAPCVFNGMSTRMDYQMLMRHRGPATVVWCGSDALKTNLYGGLLKGMKQVRHIAKSTCIQRTLAKHVPFLETEFIPITPTLPIKQPVPLGDIVYVYGVGDLYGSLLLPEVKKRIGSIEILHVGKTRFTREDLQRFVYPRTFIGIRLTSHDGLPNTVLEMGLMGRRSIHNGDVPTSLAWRDPAHVADLILHEYESRATKNIEQVAEETRAFIDIGNDWYQPDHVGLVTVMMNSYREKEQLFHRAVRAVLAQQGCKVQLLISTVKDDPCIQWAKCYSGVQVVVNAKPGIYEQINAMLPLIRGKFVCYASSNDYMLPIKCATEARLLQERGADVCYSNFYRKNGEAGAMRVMELPTQYQRALHLRQNYVSDCSMIRASTLRRYGPFRTKYHNHAFHDLWLRISASTSKFVNNPQPTWVYHRTDDSQSVKRGKDPALRDLNELQRAHMLADHR
jgi:hypothetical protein